MTGPDTAAALAFLAAWSPGGPWTLTAIKPDGRNVIQTRTFRAAEEARRWINRYQNERNIYFSVNRPRQDLTKKATKADIAALVALHVDLDPPDGTDPAEAKPALLGKLKAHDPPPNVIIDSGGGVQGFWLLREPASLNGAESIGHFEAYNRAVETALGGDHCHNIDRIMRLPGTVNLPDERKRAKGRSTYVAALVEADWDRRYELTDFVPAPDIFSTGDKPNGAGGPTARDLKELIARLPVIARLPASIIKKLRGPATNRSDTLASVYRALFDLDLDDATIERIIRAFPNGIGSKFADRNDLDKDIARVRAKSAAGRKARGKPAASDSPVSDALIAAERAKVQQQADKQLTEFNKRYAVVNEAGKVWVFEQRLDPMLRRDVLDRISFADFKKLYQNRSVEIVLKDKVKTKSLPAFWLDHPARRQYIGGVTFDPTNQAPPQYWNLWRGWAVEPQPGDWSLMQDHILSVICSGNKTHAAYLLNLAARMCQYPQFQGEVAVVLRGLKGCGKGVLLLHLQRLFGQHGVYIANSTHLVGRFNEHLRDCVMLFGDEAFFAADKAHEGVLKALTTEPSLPIEGKYKTLVLVPNMLHIWLSSNEEWVVPASHDERRYFVLNVPDSRIGNRPYFNALYQQMANGGLAAMLYDLLRRDISDFDHRDIPKTEALAEQQRLSRDSLDRWWNEVLERGFVWDSPHGLDQFSEWYDFVTTQLLEASYRQWCQEHRVNRQMSGETLGKRFTQMYGASHRKRGQIIGEVKQPLTGVLKDSLIVKSSGQIFGYTLGDLEEARDRFAFIRNIEIGKE